MNPNTERDERVRNPPCPFCKWADISTAYWNGGAWRVICPACNAEGPNALTETAANETWSKSANAATRMRDLCVAKVKSVAQTHREMAEKFKGKEMGELQAIRAEECDTLVGILQSVTLEETETHGDG